MKSEGFLAGDCDRGDSHSTALRKINHAFDRPSRPEMQTLDTHLHTWESQMSDTCDLPSCRRDPDKHLHTIIKSIHLSSSGCTAKNRLYFTEASAVAHKFTICKMFVILKTMRDHENVLMKLFHIRYHDFHALGSSNVLQVCPSLFMMSVSLVLYFNNLIPNWSKRLSEVNKAWGNWTSCLTAKLVFVLVICLHDWKGWRSSLPTLLHSEWLVIHLEI